MQPFYLPESLRDRHERLSSAATRRSQVEAAAGTPRWRRVAGGALVRAGNRLVAERCELGYYDPARPS